MTDKIRENIIIGALLHDIGKFWQRCEPEGGIDNAQFLSSEVKNNISSDVCPHRNYTNETRLSHQHAAWTYQFIANNESNIFQTVTSVDESVLHLASNHHQDRPSTTLQTIIKVADCMSAGQDRNGDIEDIKDEISRIYNYRKQRQRPVFENLFKEDIIDKKQTYRYHLEPLALSKSIFSFCIQSENQDLYPEYQTLWNGFINELEQIPKADFNTYLETLLGLLQKYTWCVPSSTNDSPDISLYDHLRSTAAIATCLYDYLKESDPSTINPGEKTKQEKIKTYYNNDEKFALLIAADISGIQKFIYQISAVKAATSLKGRSFYLQLISDAAARYILHRLDLPITNLIYSSGGNFFLLAPNTKKVRAEIEKISSIINRSLFAHYKGELFLGVGYEKLSGFDFKSNLSAKWGEAIKKTSAQKRRKFKDEIINDQSFFQSRSVKDAQPCDNCGADYETSELKAVKKGEEEKYCPLCREFIKAGDDLKSAKILLEFISTESTRPDSGKIIVPIMGIPVGYILTDNRKLDQDAAIISQTLFKKIHYLNETDFLETIAGERFNAYARGFKFYGGNYLPLNDQDEPATFDYLAGVRDKKEEETAFKRLGILRMDVDNLGKIFSKGFLCSSMTNPKTEQSPLKEPYSISRISTLSSMLDIFFSGYLNTLHQKEDFKNSLYILYSGGDDLFIVGRWDKTIDFAALIREEFKRFTCQHPDLSISGGIALTPPKYPIHRSADLAGEAESAAKAKRQINGQEKEKDALNFLGKTLSWQDFQVAQALKQDLIQWINEPENGKKAMNRGLLSRLSQIYATYQKEADLIRKQNKEGKILLGEVNERILYNKWRWRLVYSLRRFMNQNKEYKDEIEAIQTALTENNLYKDHKSEQPVIEYLDIPVQWAEYQLRTNQKEDVL